MSCPDSGVLPATGSIQLMSADSLCCSNYQALHYRFQNRIEYDVLLSGSGAFHTTPHAVMEIYTEHSGNPKDECLTVVSEMFFEIKTGTKLLKVI